MMDLQYIAGFFDGEGNVGFYRQRNGKGIFPRVIVTNTNRDILEEFMEQFGGSIHALTARKENWKQGWAWRIAWTRAVNFLSDIYPWLRIKRRQAEVVFAWNGIRPYIGRAWDKECRDFLFDMMRWLNKKGPNTELDPLDRALKEARSWSPSLRRIPRSVLLERWAKALH